MNKIKQIYICHDCLQIWDQPGLCKQPVAKQLCGGTLEPYVKLDNVKEMIKEVRTNADENIESPSYHKCIDKLETLLNELE